MTSRASVRQQAAPLGVDVGVYRGTTRGRRPTRQANHVQGSRKRSSFDDKQGWGGEMKVGGCFALVAYCGAGRAAGDEPTRKFEFRLCYLAKRQPVRFSASFYFSLPQRLRRVYGVVPVFRLVPNNLACECVYLSTRCPVYRFNLSAAWNCEEDVMRRLRHMIPAAAAAV